MVRLTHVDGTPALDRLGRQRWWSPAIDPATRVQPIGGYPPSSREIARRKAKAEEAAATAQAARTLAGQVRPAFRPPAGRLFAVDVTGLLLVGPCGGIGSSERMLRTLAPLAAGGRHPAAVLAAAGGWRDEAAQGEALKALAPKLGAVGLRIDRRKAGIRMAKVMAVAIGVTDAQ